MKTINYNGKLGRAVLAFSLMFGFGIMMSSTAQAQDRNGQWQRRDRVDQIRARREALRQREAQIIAQRRAQRQAQRNDRYHRNGTYNNGTYNNGTYNNGGYNNDGTYNNGGYRNGGYNNGGYSNANQIALNQGYQQGISTGSSDAQRRQSYSPERSKHYKNANSQAFREGFVRGYDAGYRQYAGYNNGGYDNNGGYNRTGNTGGGIGDILGAILGRP
ncbi:MAG TPA: hypothetical protein VFX97_11985 [Pyrinomonadaceae bacterium]|nr:hypothetical protein [Pyrinomonadaceae bacterium]